MEATRKGKLFNYPFQFLSFLFKLTLYAVLIGVAIYAINQAKVSGSFPIKKVQVFGVKRLDRLEVKNLLLPLVNHGFFAVNVEYIRDRLLQMPWVADIYVRRTWPDQVEITIIEKNAVANWNNQSLLSEAGELFSPSLDSYPRGLPALTGPSGKQILMLQYFAEINRLLLPLRAKISSLELSPYSTWTLRLNNGMTLQLGHKDVLTRLHHFVKVYPKIVGDRATNVAYVDLRYPNGLAVKWKTDMDNALSVANKPSGSRILTARTTLKT